MGAESGLIYPQIVQGLNIVGGFVLRASEIVFPTFNFPLFIFNLLLQLPVLVEYAGIKRCPYAGLLAADFEGIIGPGIAGVEKAITSLGLVKSIVVAVAGFRRNNNRFAQAVRLQIVVDKADQPLVLFIANSHTNALFAFLKAMIKSSMDSGIAQSEGSFESSACFQIRPGGCFEVKAFVAPAKCDIAKSGITAAGILIKNASAQS